MNKIMMPFMVLLLMAVSTDLFSMQKKRKHRKKIQQVGNQEATSKKGKNSRKKGESYIQSGDIKILEKSVEDQPTEVLIPLFKGLHSSVSVSTPKEKAQKTYSQSRVVYDALTKIYGDKKKTKEALNGTAHDFSDEEKHMKEMWQYETEEDIADPSKVVLGIMSGTTSVWKQNIFEEVRNKQVISTKNKEQIASKESHLKNLTEQIASLQKEAEATLEEIKIQNNAQELIESKLKAAETYSTELAESLGLKIEATTQNIANIERKINQLEEQSSRLRNNKNDFGEFTAQISGIKENIKNLLEEKAQEEITKKKLITSLEHVNQYIDKMQEEGSFGRRYLWGKSF